MTVPEGNRPRRDATALRRAGRTTPPCGCSSFPTPMSPARAKRLPSELLHEAEQADVVIHAGDWVDTATLDLLEGHARRLIGVFGNNDGPGLRRRLPEVARAELGGLRFGAVHETGPARGRETRCAARFPDLDVLVFGHSHIPWDSHAPGGLRLLNPGSPTDRRREPYCTYMTLLVADGALDEVTLHRVQRNRVQRS